MAKTETPSSSPEIRTRMRAMAERLTLPLKLGLRGTTGNVAATGTGSSIDFQDHRPYVPGDDPRHIDWQAYARSGHYTMKLYREEVRPLADIVLDVSASMFLDEMKTRRTLELAYFCVESALRSGATVRLFSIAGSQVAPHDVAASFEDLATMDAPETAPDLHRVPWRQASLRVLISDLLYPAAPNGLIPILLSARGRAVILSPFCRAESDPDWLGNTELLDCETKTRRDLRFLADDLRHYAATYRKHFELWRTEARRHGIPLGRVECEGEFSAAISTDALPAGAVEML